MRLRPPSGPFVATAVAWAFFVAKTVTSLQGSVAFVLYDDGMISMTYARTLARTGSLTWYPGAERVEGISNPLWTSLMAAFQLARLPDRLVGAGVQLVGLALVLAIVHLTGEIAVAIGATIAQQRAARWSAAAFLPMAYWAAIGMEVPAAAALLMAFGLDADRAARNTSRRSLVRPGIWLALALLIRTDSLVFAVPFLALLISTRRRGSASVIGIPAMTLAATTLARHHYYGVWVPNTFLLKGSGFAWDQLKSGASVASASLMGALVILVVFAVIGYLKRERTASPLDLAGALLSSFILATVYSIWVGGDFMDASNGHALGVPNRFLSTAAPFLMPLAVRGAWGTHRALLHGRRRRVAGLVLGACCLVGPGLMLVSRQLWRARWADAAAVNPSGVDRVAIHLALVAAATGVASGIAVLADRRKVAASFAIAGALLWTNVDLIDRLFVRDEFAVQRERARVGDALRRTVAPGESIAVAGAGSIVFFSSLPAIDELGKSDRFIAGEPVKQRPFIAGHSKWDATHSLISLAPDLILDRWGADQAIDRALADRGYQPLGVVAGVGSAGPLVAPGAGVDARALCALLRDSYYRCDG